MRVAAIAVVLGLWSGTAVADTADALFKKAKKLLADKKYADACAMFEKVDELDPKIGAKLNVANCFEQWGRLAVAYRWYSDAHRLAIQSKDDRAPRIKERLDEVDLNVPRVTIRVPSGADPAVITKLTLDGRAMVLASLGEEQRVDPGPHVIEYTVNGETKKKMAPVERGGSSEVELELPKVGATKTGMKVQHGATAQDRVLVGAPPSPGRTQRIVGISLASAGVVAVGVAGVLTLGARGRYNDAIDAHCMGSTTMCDPDGLTITADARHTANLATIVTLLGGAAVAGGIVLYVIAPSKPRASDAHALYVEPRVGSSSGAIVFGGRF